MFHCFPAPARIFRGLLALSASLSLALALALVLPGCGRSRAWAPEAGPRVVLVDPELDPGFPGGDPARFALGVLLTELLEYQGGLSVIRTPYAPDPNALGQGRDPGALVLRFKVAREGEHLRWTLRKAAFRDLRAGEAYREFQGPALPPAEAFRWVLAQAGGRMDPDPPGATLLPATPEVFWGYLGAMAQGNASSDLDAPIRALEELAQREPRCASIQVHLGVLRTFRMNNFAQNPMRDQTAAFEALRSALRLAPGLGRGVTFLSRLLTDVGSPREALAVIEPARKARPGDLTLLNAITYPARYAGLLDLAVASSDRFQQLNPLGQRPPRLAFHLMYAGRYDDFQESLWEWPGDLRNGTCRFHRGQVALLKGDRDRALTLMRETEQMPSAMRIYRTLAKVHRLALEGQVREAKALLKDFQDARSGLRVPDGEVTLLVAEAHVVLGNVSEGMALAREAFSQGFGCTRWFEENPLLAPLRTHAQWPWLLQHLKERQALLESRYTRAGFGL